MRLMRSLSFVFVVLALLMLGDVLAQQTRPTLTSHFKSDGLNSKGERADADVSIASSIEKGSDGLVYKYEFTNHAALEVKLLLLLSQKDHVSFVGEFITDTDKPAEYRAGRGTIFIVLKPQEVRSFAVKDNSPEVVVARIQVALVDNYDVAYARHGASIYFPAWEHIFGR